MTPERRLERAELDFEATFEAQYPRIARLIARVVHDPARAEELAVDVFWKLWRKSSDVGENVDAWLSRAAVCAGLDELRKQTRRARYERFASWLRAPPTPEALHSATEEQARVRAVLIILDRRQAEMLLLRSDGLGYREIAQALEVSPTSVGTLLSRAQESFRKEYVKRYGQ
jgi:RNA polymerase sigma factor (sigma-70 family)